MNYFLNNLGNFYYFFSIIVDNYDFFSNDWNFSDYFIYSNLILIYSFNFINFNDFFDNFLDLYNFWNLDDFFNDFLNICWNLDNSFDNSLSINNLISVYYNFSGLNNNVMNWSIDCYYLSILNNFFNNSFNFNDFRNFDYSINDFFNNSWNFNNFLSDSWNFDHFFNDIINDFNNLNWNMNYLLDFLNSWYLNDFLYNFFD